MSLTEFIPRVAAIHSFLQNQKKIPSPPGNSIYIIYLALLKFIDFHSGTHSKCSPFLTPNSSHVSRHPFGRVPKLAAVTRSSTATKPDIRMLHGTDWNIYLLHIYHKNKPNVGLQTIHGCTWSIRDLLTFHWILIDENDGILYLGLPGCLERIPIHLGSIRGCLKTINGAFWIPVKKITNHNEVSVRVQGFQLYKISIQLYTFIW